VAELLKGIAAHHGQVVFACLRGIAGRELHQGIGSGGRLHAGQPVGLAAPPGFPADVGIPTAVLQVRPAVHL